MAGLATMPAGQCRRPRHRKLVGLPRPRGKGCAGVGVSEGTMKRTLPERSARAMGVVVVARVEGPQ
jgi:hypothetical protein